MSKVEKKVIKKIKQRAKEGKEKYGVTMERTDLSLSQWIIHLQEELLDGAIYAQKLHDDANRIKVNESVSNYLIDMYETTPEQASRQDLLDIIKDLLDEH